MRLLPFAAAATNRLTFSMQTSRISVADGRWCRSEVFAGRLGLGQYRPVRLLHLAAALPRVLLALNRQ